MHLVPEALQLCFVHPMREHMLDLERSSPFLLQAQGLILVQLLHLTDQGA